MILWYNNISIFLLDAIHEAADADDDSKVKTFLLVTGDADYIKLVTQLRNRFGQKVIIAGVQGSIGGDLVASADGEDHVECNKPEPIDKNLLKTQLVKMVKRGCSPLKFWTLSIVDQWSQSPHQGINGTVKEKRDAIHELLDEKIFARHPVDLAIIGKVGTATQIILDENKAKESKYLD